MAVKKSIFTFSESRDTETSLGQDRKSLEVDPDMALDGSNGMLADEQLEKRLKDFVSIILKKLQKRRERRRGLESNRVGEIVQINFTFLKLFQLCHTLATDLVHLDCTQIPNTSILYGLEFCETWVKCHVFKKVLCCTGVLFVKNEEI